MILCLLTVMRDYRTFNDIEEMNNKIYRYFSSSHKRTNLIDEYMEELGESTFRMAQNHEVRFVASKVTTTNKLLTHYSNLYQVVSNILGRDDNTVAGLRDANAIIKFLMNSNALIAIGKYMLLA